MTAAALRGVAVLAVTGAILDPGCARPRVPVIEVAFAGQVPDTVRTGVLSSVADAAPWGTVVDASAPRRGAEVSAVAARLVAGEPAHVLEALQRRDADVAVQWMPPALVLEHVTAPARVVAGVRTAIVVGVAGVPAGPGVLQVAVTDPASGLEQASARVTRNSEAAAGSVRVSVPWLATGARSRRLRVQASLEPGAAVRPSPPGDVVVLVQPARVEVAVLEARPTWTGRFARLALVGQPGIDLRTEVRLAPGVVVRTAPARPLTDADPQVILVSGVDALTATDVSRLESGVRQQGQAVVLLLDEAPGPGPWRRLWPDAVGTRRTGQTPVTGRVADHAWKMREWLAAPGSTTVTPLASVEAGSSAFMLGRAVGAGRVVLVTALDAWRWRGDPDAAFAAGWRALVRRLGADVPPALAVTAWVSGHRRGRRVQVDAVLRPDLADGRDAVISARWGSTGTPIDLRQVEAGRWRGWSRAPAAAGGVLEAQARMGTRALGEAQAVIDVGPAALAASWDDVIGHQVRRGQLSTGVTPLPALMSQVRHRRPPLAPDRWYLTRTWWFAGAVLAALGAEWILRRSAGGR